MYLRLSNHSFYDMSTLAFTEANNSAFADLNLAARTK